MEVQQTLGGRYKLLNELGSGGMAVVWRARDEVLGRSVAVKLLAGRYAGDPQSRARIRDEARAAATLSHPNIAQVYDFGEQDDMGICLPYVVMELINGPTLAQRVAFGPLPPRTVFRIGAEVAAALAAAHADGLVHRDIKPANVMVTPGGAKVVDFGIAAAAGPGSPDDELLGTPAYLAPERLLADTIEPASDVYALGVLLYRLLANESPWSVESTTQMLDAHVYIEPTPLPQMAGVPPEVTDLIHRCLRKNPAERPSAGEASVILADAAEASVVHGLADEVRGVPVPVPVPVPIPADGVGGSLWRGDGNLEREPDKADEKVEEAPAAAPPPVPEEPSTPVSPAPHSRKKPLLIASGGVAIVVIAALLFWIFGPVGAKGGQDRVTVAPTTSVQPSAPALGPGPAPGTGDPAPASNGQTAGPGPGGMPAGGQPPATAGVPATSAAGLPPEGTATPPPTPTTEPPATAQPPSGGKTLTSAGGSVVARCKGGKAELTSWTPKDPYEVERVSAGPVVAAVIVFKNNASRIRMTVTCVAGSPTAVVLPL